MYEWHAQAWTEHGVVSGPLIVTAKTMAEVTAKLTAELDHLELVELNIWRADR